MVINVKSIPAPANKITADFIHQIDQELPNSIEGLYITGSIPLGDYYSRKSDIDFIMILKDRPTVEVIKRLKGVHLNIERWYRKAKLNGYYITIEELTEKTMSFPSFFEHTMHNNRLFELDKITLFELQTTSLNVVGPPADSLPIQIKFEEVAEQLYQNMNSYWVKWIDRHSGNKFGFLLLSAFPQLIEWGILGVARQLYTLEFRSITSKLHAGLYYMEKMPREHKDIFSIAIQTRRINKNQIKVSFKRAIQTIECMNFIKSTFNRLYSNRL